MTDQMIADRQRTAKAQQLAAALDAAGATAATIPYLDDQAWTIAAQAAGVRPASPRTRALVEVTLAQREQQPADPFAGLDLDTAYAV